MNPTNTTPVTMLTSMRLFPLTGMLVFLLAFQAYTPADEPASDSTVALTASSVDEEDLYRADSMAVADVIEQFHAAVAAADSAMAAGLLTAEALILESGGQETKEEYFSHHFHGDAAFLAGTTREPGTSQLRLIGDAAWVASISRIHGTFRDRDIDSNSAELMVLQRTPEGWRIAAIHWSSRSRNR